MLLNTVADRGRDELLGGDTALLPGEGSPNSADRTIAGSDCCDSILGLGALYCMTSNDPGTVVL